MKPNLKLLEILSHPEVKWHSTFDGKLVHVSNVKFKESLPTVSMNLEFLDGNTAHKISCSFAILTHEASMSFDEHVDRQSRVVLLCGLRWFTFWVKIKSYFTAVESTSIIEPHTLVMEADLSFFDGLNVL